ncbi:MAG: cold shock domain-containing protein [Candidatus Omnitrophica bacterium]|nr:cold shock domain-containing protein [Candidatus Omnitrophota bacterium]
MHKGKIKRLVRDKGFGFISVLDGRDIFFHQNSVLDTNFEDLKEGQEVECEVEKSPKGPRALNVRIVAEAA